MNKTFKGISYAAFSFFFLCGICFFHSQTACAKVVEGTCKKNVTWTYNSKTKELTLSGKGAATKPIYQKLRKKLPIGWDDVETINIGAGIHSINGVFFFELHNLKTIHVDPANQKYITKDGVLFTKDLSALIFYPRTKETRKYTIPATVTRIGSLAFAGNRYLTEVVCPTGLKKLGSGAFYFCTSLKNINISELTLLKNITDYYSNSIEQLTYTKDFPRGYSSFLDGYDSEYALSSEGNYLGTFEYTALQTFHMPNQLQSIANETFRCCDNLRDFYIGRDYTGDVALGDTFRQDAMPIYYMNLKNLSVHPKNSKYILKNNMLYTKDMSTLCRMFTNNNNTGDTITLDDQVKNIANGAFYYIETIKTVKSNTDLNEIGTAAFAGSSIETFEVKDGIQKIGTGAFADTPLKTLRCNGAIHKVGDYSFSGLDLKTFHCLSIHEIGDEAFYSCNELQTVDTISIYKIGTRSFAYCKTLTNIPLTEQSLYDSTAFEGCEKLNLNKLSQSATVVATQMPPTTTKKQHTNQKIILYIVILIILIMILIKFVFKKRNP